MPSYSRLTLQKLAESKLDDAKLLFAHGRCSNAYYLGGYSVELGLKAALTRQIGGETLPDRRFVNDAYTHKPDELVRLAGLLPAIRAELDSNANFASNWGIVSGWEEGSRYESVDPFKASAFMSALLEPENGVSQWVRRHW
ncbi:MAG: hypothetical protein JWQ36_2263 [Enterovirga sp.]|nr:hypothetical protein [Enterovirga sp.]